MRLQGGATKVGGMSGPKGGVSNVIKPNVSGVTKAIVRGGTEGHTVGRWNVAEGKLGSRERNAFVGEPWLKIGPWWFGVKELLNAATILDVGDGDIPKGIVIVCHESIGPKFGVTQQAMFEQAPPSGYDNVTMTLLMVGMLLPVANEPIIKGGLFGMSVAG